MDFEGLRIQIKNNLLPERHVHSPHLYCDVDVNLKLWMNAFIDLNLNETERGMLEILEELIGSGVTSGDLGLQQNMWVSRMAAPYPHGSK